MFVAGAFVTFRGALAICSSDEVFFGRIENSLGRWGRNWFVWSEGSGYRKESVTWGGD